MGSITSSLGFVNWVDYMNGQSKQIGKLTFQAFVPFVRANQNTSPNLNEIKSSDSSQIGVLQFLWITISNQSTNIE